MPRIMNPAAQRILAPGRNIQTRQSWQGATGPPEPVFPAGSHANIQLYNQNLPGTPNGAMSLDSGNFFFLLSAAAAINLLIQYATGATEIMQGIQAGSQIKRVKPWQRAILTGTASTAVSFWHGYEFSREDQTNFQSTIATISGAVSVVQALATYTLTDHADVTVAATTLDTTIAANAARHGVNVGSLSSNAPATKNIRVGNSTMTAAGGRGTELQPGQFISLFTPNAVYVANPDGNPQVYWWEEF
jgi:hypothetical protein